FQVVALWCLAIQALILTSSLPAYYALGFVVEWDGALPILLIVAILTAFWAYFAFTKSSQLELLIGDVSLAVALLLLMAVIMPPAQYAAAALGFPLIDPQLARIDAWLGIDVAA